MVDFTLTEEQRNMREMAQDFAANVIRPVAWEYDQDGTWPAAIIRGYSTRSPTTSRDPPEHM